MIRLNGTLCSFKYVLLSVEYALAASLGLLVFPTKGIHRASLLTSHLQV